MDSQGRLQGQADHRRKRRIPPPDAHGPQRRLQHHDAAAPGVARAALEDDSEGAWLRLQLRRQAHGRLAHLPEHADGQGGRSDPGPAPGAGPPGHRRLQPVQQRTLRTHPVPCIRLRERPTHCQDRGADEIVREDAQCSADALDGDSEQEHGLPRSAILERLRRGLQPDRHGAGPVRLRAAATPQGDRLLPAERYASLDTGPAHARPGDARGGSRKTRREPGLCNLKHIDPPHATIILAS
ncbi:hypothetical protein VARIO8X_120507 [Burkholderiales bacterium 8X]|nr:hypothetical protein VARIO8X_120507 [Burkholderiales bacterium 8X]